MRWMIVAAMLAACSGTEPDGDDTGAPRVRELSTDGGTFSVSWTPDPDPIAFNELFSLAVDVEPGDGTSIVVDATMPQHGHGMNTDPEVTGEDGDFDVSGMLFHMSGYWELTVEVTDGSTTETATFGVDCCDS